MTSAKKHTVFISLLGKTHLQKALISRIVLLKEKG
jgi:hypothetical protein